MRRYSVGAAIAVVILLFLTYIPFLYVLINSVKSGPEITNHPLQIMLTFHGHNYVSAWLGIYRYLGNTVGVAILSIIIGVPTAAMGSYAFAQLDLKFKEYLFYGFLGLLMIPWTLTLIPLFLEIHTFHLFNTWWALILPYAAGSQPLLIFMFRTFFEGIPHDLYESARLDGCSELKILLRIVTPLSMPILLTGTILMTNSIWGDYLWPSIVLTNYKLQTVSAGLEIFLNGFGLTSAGVGPEFAAYIISIVPILILVGFTMKHFVNGITNGALKM